MIWSKQKANIETNKMHDWTKLNLATKLQGSEVRYWLSMLEWNTERATLIAATVETQCKLIKMLSNSYEVTGAFVEPLYERKKNISNDDHEAPSPRAINPDWKIFLTAWLPAPVSGLQYLEITLNRTTRQTLPVCSLAPSSLPASTASSASRQQQQQRVYCETQTRLLLFSVNVTPTKTSRNECVWIKWSIRTQFTWFQMLFCYWSFHYSSFSLSICLLLPHLSALSFPHPTSSISPILKSLPRIDFSSFSSSPVGFFSPSCESPFCSTVATQSGSAVWAEALGKRSVRRRGERGGRRNHCKVAD